MRNKKFAVLAVSVALAALTSFAAAAGEEFQWAGVVQPGQAIEIKGVNGNIEAHPTSGSQVEVTAYKTGRRNDPSEVRIEVVPHAGGVTVCAVYPDAEGRNECQPGGHGRMNVRNNDVKVEFKVLVPEGVHFVGRNVNGGVAASGIRGDVRVYTVNGNADVDCEGAAQAKTVNGSIRVSMGASDFGDDLEFESVNGSITVEMPRNASAEVSAKTVNGGIDSDFPLDVKGRWGPKSARGTIGQGGPRLSLKTVNGGIDLKAN